MEAVIVGPGSDENYFGMAYMHHVTVVAETGVSSKYTQVFWYGIVTSLILCRPTETSRCRSKTIKKTNDPPQQIGQSYIGGTYQKIATQLHK